MTRDITPIDLSGISTYSIKDRPSKVSSTDFARVWQKGGSFNDFLGRLPKILAADDLRAVVTAIVKAYANGKHVVWGMGGHVIKTGLNPIIIDLMRRGVITAVAMNGSCIVHDLEVALVGKTSEEVSAVLGEGRFGMAEETCSFLCGAIETAEKKSLGLGAAVGQAICEAGLPKADLSILAEGARLNIPVTVHVALGTDIIHMHPGFDPAAAGHASHLDFRIFSALVADLEGGVYVNAGSAVILPEVFLKAVSVVRNLGHKLKNFSTANLDFIRHYRPMTNVVNRPTAEGGHGYNLTGHHEIMIPLIAAGVIEAIEK
jgi:hypothetical protein